MRGALKVKLQNALNQAILANAEDRGIFVGGRRRNRKRRRNKHGMKLKVKLNNAVMHVVLANKMSKIIGYL